MSKLLLVNAPVSVNSPRTAFPPLALLVLSQALREVRATTAPELQWEVVDLDLRLKQGRYRDDPTFFEQAADDLWGRAPSACLFTVHGVNLAVILQLAELVKARMPACRVILGGVGATLQAESLVRTYATIDAVIRYEGETALPALVAALQGRGDLSTVPGAVTRRGDEIVSVAPLPFLAGDRIPAADYTAVDLDLYREQNRKYPYIHAGFALVESGRGCRWNCSFCAPNRMWQRQVRYRPIPAILDEVRYLHERGFDFPFFTQDNLDGDFLDDLSRALIDSGLRLGWGCYARLDRLTDETAALMARSGCRLVFAGFETPNPGEQKLIRKTMDRDEVLRRVAQVNSLGIRLIGSFIAGFPDESDDELERTLCFATECSAGQDRERLEARLASATPTELLRPSANFCTVHPLSYMPGTDTYDGAREHLRFSPYPLHHDSYGTYLFGLNDFVRENWAQIFTPFVTHLPEARQRFYYSSLRLFNFWNARPLALAKAVQANAGHVLPALRGVVDELGEELVLTARIEDFEARAADVVGRLLGIDAQWTAERSAQNAAAGAKAPTRVIAG